MEGLQFGSLWKSAIEAAEKAKSVAQAVSSKSLELAEATAEEAGKKLKDLGLANKISLPGAKVTPPSQEELEYYGITSAFIEYLRSLNYNTFQDHSKDDATVTEPPASGFDSSDAPRLNPWQVRHATLVIRIVKEVNELRYVLCPRYMTDGQFWVLYFSLARKHLPDIAFSWNADDPLPSFSSKLDFEDAFLSLPALQEQLKAIGSRIHDAAVAATRPATGELSVSSDPNKGAKGLQSSGETKNAAASATLAAESSSLLVADPDLEEYLQIGDGGKENDYDNNNDELASNAPDDIDLDQYLDELSASIEGAGGEEGQADSAPVDVDAVLREMEAEEKTAEEEET